MAAAGTALRMHSGSSSLASQTLWGPHLRMVSKKGRGAASLSAGGMTVESEK